MSEPCRLRQDEGYGACDDEGKVLGVSPSSGYELMSSLQSSLHSTCLLYYYMSRIFEDQALPHSSAGLHVDRKLRRKIQEKKIAMGHKPDDEEEQTQGRMVMGGM